VNGTRAFRAPGRVNLIGEHTDYTGGLVLPVAIPLGISVIGRPGGEAVELESDRFGEGEGWRRYVDAVAGRLGAGAGFRGSIVSDLPSGAGLASSAALEVAVALALCEANELTMDRLELAELCRRAEEQAVGVPCGLMDQAASLLARAGHALLLDCGTLEYRHVPFPPELELLVADSGSHRRLEDSGYAQRRAEVEAGEPHRLRHVHSENERVREVAAALENGDRGALARAFAASHASLRDDFEVSTPELDRLVEAALAGGALAARMTGGGFGGSIVAVVERGTGAEVGAVLDAPYFVARPSGAAHSIRPAHADEAAAAEALVQRAYGHYVERIGRRPSPMDDDYAALVAAGEAWLLVDEQLAGLVVLRTVDDYLLVVNVAVDPERQGEGLGRALLAFADHEARLRGLQELRLFTNVAMTENIALYGRLGWQEFDRTGDGTYSRVHFRKRPGEENAWRPRQTSRSRSGRRSRKA
jgi:galactokinase